MKSFRQQRVQPERKGGRDGRYPNTEPNRPTGGASFGPVPGLSQCTPGNAKGNPLCIRGTKDFEDRYQYEGFLQVAVQTDYMHGRLQPRIAAVIDISGIFVFVPSL